MSFVMRLGALLLLSRSCAWTDHSSRCYLRVLRASPSCICAGILALQCCRQAIADVLPHRRLSRCSEHCKRWDRAYRDRPALPRNGNNTSTDGLPIRLYWRDGWISLWPPGLRRCVPLATTGQNHCAEVLVVDAPHATVQPRHLWARSGD